MGMHDGGTDQTHAATGLPPGWGYAPSQGAPPHLPPPPPPAAGRWPTPSQWPAPGQPLPPELAQPRRIPWPAILVLVAAPLLLGGALLYVAASPKGTHLDVRVIESPTATGGVLLDAPQRTVYPGVSGTIVRNQPWETHDLDPAGLEVGDMVDVQVHSDCLCDPFIDEGSAIGQIAALVMVGLGIVAAAAAFIVNRLPGRKASRVGGGVAGLPAPLAPAPVAPPQ
ncbi:MAG: hypothetical protein ACTHN0_02845 [Aquihabitans sp.]